MRGNERPTLGGPAERTLGGDRIVADAIRAFPNQLPLEGDLVENPNIVWIRMGEQRVIRWLQHRLENPG